jgi:hypothetical protein
MEHGGFSTHHNFEGFFDNPVSALADTPDGLRGFWGNPDTTNVV